ncbi:MAG: hypothetical protein LBT20_04390, partial [Clostridiales bacterium]|nr:hypothetical protein [Clostridiales bacterium]
MKQNDLRLEKISVRNVLIDNFKGIVVLLYMMSHIIIHMDSVPEFDTPIWLKHSNPIMIPSWGFNPLDLGPIFFYFVMGFVLFSSFLRKYEKIGRAAYKQVFIRNMAFLGVFLGLQVAAGGFAPPPDLWNTVPSIGFTALLAIPFLHPRISKSPWIKLILGVAVLVFYHFARDILFKYLAS